MLIFESSLPGKEPSVDTFSEMCALTSREYVVLQVRNIAKLWENY